MAIYNDIQKREIFHFLFLEELLRISDPKLYVLKGGVNLRFFFRSPRYSEDMDIDVLAGNVSTLKKNGYKILESPRFQRSLGTYGIASIELNDPKTAKHTETTQRFRVRLVSDTGENLPTKVEFSRRGSQEKPFALEKLDPQIAQPYQRLAFRCQHYTGNSAVLQKIEALAGREVTQARDVFDLGILHSGGFSDPQQIKKELAATTLKKAKACLLSIDYKQFEGQVLEFLAQDTGASFESEDAWDALKLSVLEMLGHEK
jgi:predicted nucleotidyltransferase component of viral defense system